MLGKVFHCGILLLLPRGTTYTISIDFYYQLHLSTDLYGKNGEKSEKSSANFGCMGNQVEKKCLKTKKQSKIIKNQKSLQNMANFYFKQSWVFAITSSTYLRTSSNAYLYF